MDTSRFTDPADEFPFLDLTARFAFKTSSSVSFHVGRIADVYPDNEHDFVVSAFVVIGWIDVHHPCDSVIKAQIRICIPVEYHQFERMEEMFKAICEALSIPPDEPCESTIFNSENVTGIINSRVYLGMG